MKRINSLLFIILAPLSGFGQQTSVLTALQGSVRETSGLLYLDKRLITHNDSGGEPVLYEIDSVSGDVIRRVAIGNATNTDWEDLCRDSTHIYIADFGNNEGSRRDLRIYRLPVSDYLLTDNDTVWADTILFYYSDQRDFTQSLFTTNFDAEALICYGDSLYIFTKNWGNNWTNIYALPKIPGSYQVEKIDSINAAGLVSGATYNPCSGSVLLTGYTFSSHFIIAIRDFEQNGFSGGSVEKYALEIQPGSSIQIEGIAAANENQYFLTAEESFSGKSTLYVLDLLNLSNSQTPVEMKDHIYPNPTSESFRIRHKDLLNVKIYDLQGSLRKTCTSEQIHVTDLNEGVYIIIAESSQGIRTYTYKLIIE
jgi:hypothetical protein